MGLHIEDVNETPSFWVEIEDGTETPFKVLVKGLPVEVEDKLTEKHTKRTLVQGKRGESAVDTKLDIFAYAAEWATKTWQNWANITDKNGSVAFSKSAVAEFFKNHGEVALAISTKFRTQLKEHGLGAEVAELENLQSSQSGTPGEVPAG